MFLRTQKTSKTQSKSQKIGMCTATSHFISTKCIFLLKNKGFVANSVILGRRKNTIKHDVFEASKKPVGTPPFFAISFHRNTPPPLCAGMAGGLVGWVAGGLGGWWSGWLGWAGWWLVAGWLGLAGWWLAGAGWWRAGWLAGWLTRLVNRFRYSERE